MLTLYVLVQIVVESLPVSSSSHVRIAEWLCGIDFQTLFPHYLDHLLHGPTVLIMVVFFRKSWIQRLWLLSKGLVHGVRTGEYSYATRRLLNIMVQLCGYLVITTLLAVFGYAIIAKCFKHTSWYAGSELLLAGLISTACMLFSLYWEPEEHDAVLNWRSAALLGTVQACALLPGISRFAGTYVCARWLRIAPRRAFELSFLLELPLLVLAVIITGIGGFLKDPMSEFYSISMVGVIGCATVLGYAALWLMWKCALGRRLWLMGFYMILPISIVLCFLRK